MCRLQLGMPFDERCCLSIRCLVPGPQNLPESQCRGEVRAEERRRKRHRLRLDSRQDWVKLCNCINQITATAFVWNGVRKINEFELKLEEFCYCRLFVRTYRQILVEGLHLYWFKQLMEWHANSYLWAFVTRYSEDFCLEKVLLKIFLVWKLGRISGRHLEKQI